ncbi:biotin--[acetyl-CoA-carboxylase] ligase, partial [Parabacteroides sp. OttesenSCG-928-G07]|nr:biotin--[acetyl-CoA-carboxylase] ligase [Parabacteroides sp. OttesenSCG-928-G07]
DLSGNTIYCSIIGIGININQEVFRSKAPNPISLLQITGKKYHREDILDMFLSYFYSYYLLLLQEKQDEIREAYNHALYRKDNYHRYKDDNGIFEAIIADIEPSGHLLLQLQDGSIRRYAFKEVSFIPDNDYFC